MNQQLQQPLKERPPIISLMCVLTFIFLILASLLAVLEGSYDLFTALQSVAALAGIIGIWKMKMWGLIVVSCLFVIDQFLLSLSGMWTAAYLLRLIPLSILYYYMGKYTGDRTPAKNPEIHS